MVKKTKADHSLYLRIKNEFEALTEANQTAKIPAGSWIKEVYAIHDKYYEVQHKLTDAKLQKLAEAWFKAHPKWIENAVDTEHWIYPSGAHKTKRRCRIIARKRWCHSYMLTIEWYPTGHTDVYVENIFHYLKETKKKS